MTAGRPTRFVTKNGSVLHYEEHGQGSGPPVVCLHGIGGGAYFFTGFARRLADRHRVVTLDLPGTGRSVSGTIPFTLESMAADLGDFVRAHVGGPVVLLGHSFGTILALKAWETWPAGSIRGMIFACGLPKARPNIRERLSERAIDIAAHGIDGWGPKVSPGVFSKRSLRDLPETTALFERLFEDQEPGSYVRIIDVLLAADQRAVAPSVTVPCAAVVGAADSYAPPDAAREFLATLPTPCPLTVLEHSAHMPFYEEPDAFAAAAEGFLDELT